MSNPPNRNVSNRPQTGLPVQSVSIPASPSSPNPPDMPQPSAAERPTRGIRMRVNSFGFGSRAKDRESPISPVAVEQPAKAKGRLRAGTWKGGSGDGTGSRSSNSSSRGEIPRFPEAEKLAATASSPMQGTTDPGNADVLIGSSVTASRSPLISPAISPPPQNNSPAAAGFNRRKVSGRSNSIRNLLGIGINSSGSSSGGNGGSAGSTSTSTPSDGKQQHPLGILRRMGSKSFLNVNQTREANSSSDNLSMNSTESQSSNKLSESLKMFGRRRGKSVSKSSSENQRTPTSEFGHHPSRQTHSDSLPVLGSRRSGESSRSSVSGVSLDRRQRSAEIDGNRHSEGTDTAEAQVGIPRRLSGWLYNMVGNDNNTSQGPSEGSTLSPVKEADVAERSAQLSPTKRTRELSNRGSLSEASVAGEAGNLSSSNTAAAPLAKSRAGALLQSFASGPNKATKPGSATSSNNAGGGWVPAGVGLDRAFKFFLDNDADEKADEGIWLLGVWHGPSSDVSSKQTADPDPQTSSVALPESTPQDPSVTHPSQQSDERSPDSAHVGLPPTSSASATDAAESKSGNIPGRGEASSPPSSLLSRERRFAEQSRVGSSGTTAETNSTAASIRSISSATSLQTHSQLAGTAAVSDWQVTFQPDFSSRIWCTYRNHFAPIARDGTISEQASSAAELVAVQNGNAMASMSPSADPLTPTSPSSAGRNWLGRRVGDSATTQDSSQPQQQAGMSPVGLGAALGASYATASTTLGEKMGISNLWGRATAAAQAAGFSRAGLTTDAGWGCMLRTGQSLLANALIDVHLGRSWQREPAPLRQHQLLEQVFASSRSDRSDEKAAVDVWRKQRNRYAKYIKILSWFFDDPSPACPFGVHRMAREGKRLGKEVGEWFGPSTAAGAIKQLVSEYPEAGIGVELAHDGVFYLDEVRAAAVQRSNGGGSRRRASAVWQRPVLILIGIRLGLDSVNPIYYESVKSTFSFPQSVGIAGGRPSSSYYFMGHQGNSLFYLDPHNVRPAVPLRYPPKVYPSAVPEHLDVARRYERHPSDDEQEWWAHAYSEAQSSTFHCEKVRRMPIKSLDPSMLLGFLVKDEASLQDLCSRIKALPKTIFSFADTAPRWVDDDDFDPSMESFSESSVTGDFEGEDAGEGAELGEDAATMDRSQTSKVEHEKTSSPLPTPLESSYVNTGFERGQAAQSKQRTVDWIGRGLPMQKPPGIAFPSIDDQESAQRSSRHDLRQASTSSEATARIPSSDTDRNLTASYSGRSLLTAGGAAPNLGDESFSTMHLSDSEADAEGDPDGGSTSAWEEVSEVGTIAASRSSQSQTNGTGSASLRDHGAETTRASGDAFAVAAARYTSPFDPVVLVERPDGGEVPPPQSPSSDSELVAINLNTPVREESIHKSGNDTFTVPHNLVNAKGVDGGGSGVGTPTGTVIAAAHQTETEPEPERERDYFGLTSAHTPLSLPRRRTQSRVLLTDAEVQRDQKKKNSSKGEREDNAAVDHDQFPPLSLPPSPPLVPVPLANSSQSTSSSEEEEEQKGKRKPLAREPDLYGPEDDF